MEIFTRPVVELVPYHRHLRKNDHAVQRMVASIKEFGFKIPVLVRSTGEIVDGDLRLKAAIQLGMKEVPVIGSRHPSGSRPFPRPDNSPGNYTGQITC